MIGYFEMVSVVGARVFLSAFVIGCGLAISQAAAATFSFTLDGTVEAPATGSTAEMGGPFRLTVIFDEAGVEGTVSDDDTASYAISTFSGSVLEVGGQTFDLATGPGSATFFVINDSLSGDVLAGAFALAPVFALGADLGAFTFGLEGGASLSGNGLIAALGATDYEFASSSVFGNLLEADFETDNFIGSVQSTDLSIVPLPGAIVAYGSMLLAFGGLGGLMRRRTGITHA